ELEAARLEHNRLTYAIETAVSEGKILKIWAGKMIPISEVGKVIIKELKDAEENKDDIEPQTASGVLTKLNEALEPGEIIGISGFIPLSLESIPLIIQFVTCLEKKEITPDNQDVNGLSFK